MKKWRLWHHLHNNFSGLREFHLLGAHWTVQRVKMAERIIARFKKKLSEWDYKTPKEDKSRTAVQENRKNPNLKTDWFIHWPYNISSKLIWSWYFKGPLITIVRWNKLKYTHRSSTSLLSCSPEPELSQKRRALLLHPL